MSVDEKDIFDSDFGSTDEGSEADDDESGEKKLERENRDAARVGSPLSPAWVLTDLVVFESNRKLED